MAEYGRTPGSRHVPVRPDPVSEPTEVRSAGSGARRQMDDRRPYDPEAYSTVPSRTPGDEPVGVPARGDFGMAASAPSALALIAGLWLAVSRFVYDYLASGSSRGGVSNGILIGIAIAVIALVRLSNTRSSPMLSAANVVLGAWMIASPWVFGYARWGAGSQPAWSDVITGAVVVLVGLASWSAGTARAVTTNAPAA